MALAINFKAIRSVAGHLECWQSQMVRSEKPSLFQRLANRRINISWHFACRGLLLTGYVFMRLSTG